MIFPYLGGGFRDEAQKNVLGIIVSHKVQSKISGALHDETFYGTKTESEKNSEINDRIYTQRVDLKSLSKARLKSLRDDKLKVVWGDSYQKKKIVMDHLLKHGDFKEYPSFQIPSGESRQIKHIKLELNKNPEKMTSHGRNKTFVIKMDIHHMVIYQTPEEEFIYEVVSRFDAAMRVSKRQPVIQRNNGNNQFLMSICIGETFFIPANEEQSTHDRYVNIVALESDGRIQFREINKAQKNYKGEKVIERESFKTLLGFGVEKVNVDPIGRIFPKND